MTVVRRRWVAASIAGGVGVGAAAGIAFALIFTIDQLRFASTVGWGFGLGLLMAVSTVPFELLVGALAGGVCVGITKGLVRLPRRAAALALYAIGFGVVLAVGTLCLWVILPITRDGIIPVATAAVVGAIGGAVIARFGVFQWEEPA